MSTSSQNRTGATNPPSVSEISPTSVSKVKARNKKMLITTIILLSLAITLITFGYKMQSQQQKKTPKYGPQGKKVIVIDYAVAFVIGIVFLVVSLVRLMRFLLKKRVKLTYDVDDGELYRTRSVVFTVQIESETASLHSASGGQHTAAATHSKYRDQYYSPPRYEDIVNNCTATSPVEENTNNADS